MPSPGGSPGCPRAARNLPGSVTAVREPISRRKVLGGAAIGGAVVWVAPAVASVSAASAATAPPLGPELMVNGGFESGVPGDAVPNWFVPA